MRSFRLVIIESPYRGACYEELEANITYARACMHDALMRREAPYASHLLYTQQGVLDDKDPVDRELGISAGLAWGEHANATAVYVDRGIFAGMVLGITRARESGRPVEYRSLYGNSLPTQDPN
ncbi:MAG: hypothetical protein A2845_05555 [Candidatus Lloydbacteria bacterium RIFCSPHIGHO2_01_FULL_49_22]|uniref:DUF7768 domain-containing protein n=1 Tax=Candidatus Lloydbacteria bacterium RIFCSPHIGHO2_01_FULL_49_22 TaxID=1798658 RepID=A0A1G2CU93_9BACT|nr:MAG: hypothetical protein A2845_05555 [Candidatus Lloydbacteria bacterium RIFCSPHIGHO2_01_FULL_49_22]OGZ09668.1 MAG: hypothetical protein A3C14_02865 [Candidatus Lloydbacteria bacterium RIFCSPHIGHO2_02_FULL_50_18]